MFVNTISTIFLLFKQYNIYFYNIFSSTCIFTIFKQYYKNNIIEQALISTGEDTYAFVL